MNASPHFFNWSVQKILDSEPDSFNRARIKILFFILLLAIIKILVALSVSLVYNQDFQFIRAVIALVFYFTFIKLLLWRKSLITLLTHLLIVTGWLIACSIIFVSAHQINIVALQFVFMIILSSFYLLNRPWGIFYSLLAIIPLMIFLFIVKGEHFSGGYETDELAWPGQWMIIFLNFFTFTIAHYLYREAFNENIIEREVLNNQLKISLTNAEKLAQSKSDFLSTMSHELRTPLSMVIGMTELLRDTPHNKEQEENLRLLNFAAVNLHAIINDILDFNKIDSGKIQLEKVSVNVVDTVNSICVGMEIQAREKGLKLIYQADEVLKNKLVVTDPIRLSQIIYNLIGNAIKFTTNGSVNVSISLQEVRGNQLKIRFDVKDTGIGIDAEKQQTIFEPFMQASSNTTRNYGGTGLGLSIVRELLTLFKSRIEMQSTPGVGSQFGFDLWVDEGSEKEELQPQAINFVEDISHLKILVAEDNHLNSFLIKKICAKWGIEPVIVSNGLLAVQAVEKNEYDIILMDLHMPEMDGYEATELIRRKVNHQPRITIIALTASVSGNLEDKISECGMDDYVRKPFNAGELYLKLKKVSDLKKANKS